MDESVDKRVQERLFWKAVRPDLRTRKGYRWAPPGRSDRVPADPGGWLYPPVGFEGDYGIWVAKTFRGASLGGHGVGTALIVSVPEDDVLAEDGSKARIRSYTTWEIVDVHELIRRFGTGGDFASADLERASLKRASLRGADLSGASLNRADLRKADLRKARLEMTYLIGADLREADLSGAYLRRADLRRTDLSGAYLGGADLSGVSLDRARLTGANLAGACLNGANLSGAYLSGVNFSGADLVDASYTRFTRWPEGFDMTQLLKGSR